MWAAVAVLGMCMIGWGQKTGRAPSEESSPHDVQRLTKELAEAKREIESLRRQAPDVGTLKRQLQTQQAERDRLQEELKQANDRIAELVLKLDMQEQLTARSNKGP